SLGSPLRDARHLVGAAIQGQLVLRLLELLNVGTRNRGACDADPLAYRRSRLGGGRRLQQGGSRPMGVRPVSHGLAESLDLLPLRQIRLEKRLVLSSTGLLR